MFTRRKSLFKRKSFYITVFAVLGVGFLLFSLISSPDEAEAENISTNVKQPVAENIVDSNNFSEDSEQKIVSQRLIILFKKINPVNII